GIGLVNLLPLGPLDGGRMLLITLPLFTKNEKAVKRIFNIISFISLLIILVNFLPWIVSFFQWLGKIMMFG
ncbi:MAG: M50 family metallopeptidase, partial [Nanoarchaeota archaeon]|nr:M50 family metallopeptidase [Nanoarchaeota archaeon]